MSWLVRMTIPTELAYKQGFFDSYAWHKALWDCFPDQPDKKRNFLTRIDEHQGYFTVWIVAQSEPVRPEWCPETKYDSKKIAPAFLSHQLYSFDLRVNPTRALVRHDENGRPVLNLNGKRKSSKRIPIVKEEELQIWLERKASSGGFRISDAYPLEIERMTEDYFSQKRNKAWHGSVRFRGMLEVTDHSLFEKTYYTGIGGAKGFGFGLLLLVPVNDK